VLSKHSSFERPENRVERNVRFIQVVSGPVDVEGDDTVKNWDAHRDLEKNHGPHAAAIDKPIAGLLTDLKSRGLLDQTLVVWTSEFGRTSYGQSGNGRDHNPWGYTQWLAGGGVKAGTTFGATDDIGLQSVGKKVDTYDLHATVLQLMGLDHLKTIYLRNGRAERPTVVYGKVVKELLADRSIR
jgi:membrane-anchored protein YejM (alkaline phosphatase superfamily)